MNRLTRTEVERIGDIYFILTYAEYSNSLALSHENAIKILWDMIQLLNLDCTRDKLNRIVHYWKQVNDLEIEQDCQLGVVCDYVFDSGFVPNEYDLEPYSGGLLA